jgi:hypothetical protein
MRNARIHRLLFYLVISHVGIVEGQVTTALFTSPVISIPFTRVGNQGYSDIVLKWDGSLGFDVLTVGPESQAMPNIPTAEYSQATNILKIHSLSIAGRPHRNATFRLNSLGKFEYQSIEQVFSDESSTISIDLEDFPQSDNPAMTLQMVSLLDLNADGKKDILAHFWHGNYNAGPDYYGEVPNKLMAFLQDDNRSFTLANKQIFGTEDVDLAGSASRKQAIGDFNADGYPDVAYAMNREDGRPGVYYPGTPNWGSLPIVVLSNGDGSYAVTQPGPESIWYHAVAAAPNELGYDDVIYRPLISGDNALAYRFESGAWSSIDTYPAINGWEIQATDDLIWATDVSAVELFTKSNGIWKSSSRIETLATNESVEFVTWNGDIFEGKVTNISGKDRSAIAFSESCIIDGGRFYVTQLDSRILPSDWRELDRVVETELPMEKAFVIYEYRNGELSQNDNLIPKQLSRRHSYRFSCSDVNGDGLDDIFASTEDESNLLYLQSEEHVFKLQSELIFPAHTFTWGNRNQVRSIYEDIDGDGYNDLMYYHNSPSITQKQVNFEIYWGR